MGEKKSKSLQDLKAAEISGLKLGAYAVQNQIDGHRLYEAKRLGSHWNRIFKRHRTPQEQASKGSRPSPQRAPKYASLGGFSTRSGRLEARRWRAGRSLNLHGAQDWTLVSGLTLMLAMACRHSAQRHRRLQGSRSPWRQKVSDSASGSGSEVQPRLPPYPWAAAEGPSPGEQGSSRSPAAPGWRR